MKRGRVDQILLGDMAVCIQDTEDHKRGEVKEMREGESSSGWCRLITNPAEVIPKGTVVTTHAGMLNNMMGEYLARDKSNLAGHIVLSAPTPSLEEAAKALYHAAAHWSPDRDVETDALWENLRDALGLEPGSSPKPQEETAYRITDNIVSGGYDIHNCTAGSRLYIGRCNSWQEAIDVALKRIKNYHDGRGVIEMGNTAIHVRKQEDKA